MTPTNVKVTVDGKEHDFLTGGGADGKGKELDTAKLRNVLDKMPSVAEMQVMISKNALIDGLKKIDPLLPPLLRWIIGSNRARTSNLASPPPFAHSLNSNTTYGDVSFWCADLRQLLLTERMKSMISEFQFVFLSASPDKEARFRMFDSPRIHRAGV